MLLELNHSQVRHAAIGHENYARTSEVMRARPKVLKKTNYVIIVQAKTEKNSRSLLIHPLVYDALRHWESTSEEKLSSHHRVFVQ
jgi:integrase